MTYTHVTMSVCLLLALALVAACAAVAMCPPDGSVTADTHAVGCANLRLTIAADNVTLVIEGATGTINVMANAAGTTLGAFAAIGPSVRVRLPRSRITSPP